MAATSISQMIWFIVAVIIATSTSLAFIGIMDNYAVGIRDAGRESAGSLKTDVRFINDPATVPYDKVTENIIFYIKNTGDNDIETTSIVLVANGTALSGASLTVTVIVNGPALAYGSVAQVSGKVPKLKEGINYFAWINVNGLSHNGDREGSATDSINFNVKYS
jgi:archaellum component FlaG (FlaF/FlaG flagellin family)